MCAPRSEGIVVTGLPVNRLPRKPSSLRYYQDGPPPSVDLTTWHLVVDGLGVVPTSLDYDSFRRLPRVEQYRRSVCVCNWSIRERWFGPLLASILEQAVWDGVTSERYLKQTSIGTPDKGTYDSTIPLGDALERDALLADTLNGAPLPMERGFPVRLLDFGLYGYKGVKGLARLEIVNRFELGVWERKAGYAKEGTIRPKRYWICDLGEHRFVGRPGEVVEF